MVIPKLRAKALSIKFPAALDEHLMLGMSGKLRKTNRYKQVDNRGPWMRVVQTHLG